MTVNEAIKVLKKVKHWIDYGAGELEPTADTVIEAIDTVVQQLEKPTYTPADMDSFAEWCSYMGWITGKDTGMWWNRNYKIKDKTTTQLREDWEAKQKGEELK